MKTVRHTAQARDNLLHIETDGCIVNIRVGLSDSEGRRVTSVEIIPEDESRSPDADGRFWELDGARNNRVIRKAVWVCKHCQDRLTFTGSLTDGTGAVFFGEDGGNICPAISQQEYLPHEPAAT